MPREREPRLIHSFFDRLTDAERRAGSRPSWPRPFVSQPHQSGASTVGAVTLDVSAAASLAAAAAAAARSTRVLPDTFSTSSMRTVLTVLDVWRSDGRHIHSHRTDRHLSNPIEEHELDVPDTWTYPPRAQRTGASDIGVAAAGRPPRT